MRILVLAALALAVLAMPAPGRDFRASVDSLTLAHQYLHQLEAEVRHAVLGNVGTLISFRVGPEDARVIAAEFQPTFSTFDLMNLPNRDFYLKVMIDGAPSKPFSARTLNSASQTNKEPERSLSRDISARESYLTH